MTWLGIDVGTSAVKTVIADEAGRVVAEQSVALHVSRPAPLWSEQNPEDWWTATVTAVRALPHSARSTLRGIGLAGQMHGAVLLDARDSVLRPAILWNDGRSARQCESLNAFANRCTGNPALPGFTAPKLAWVREHEPHVFAGTKRVLLPKDFLRLRMTGDAVSEMSDASGTLWLDVAQRCWSDEMLDATGLTQAAMPRLVEGSAISGSLRPAVAEELGVPRIPVAGGAGDQAAGAIGTGVVSSGDTFLSLGTSGAIFKAADDFASNANKAVHAFCHALPRRWHTMAVTLSAAACVDWVARLGGYSNVEAALADAAKHLERASATPLFLPYLSGERTPLNDPHAQGVFFGLTLDTDRGALVAAVLEGVAYSLRDAYEALTTGTPQTARRNIQVIGGGARSALWVQVLSDILGAPLVVSDSAAAGPAFGAARLARLAVDEESAESVCTPPPPTQGFSPRVARFDPDRLVRFRRLYTALKHEF
jgi:xylulokinase